MLARPLLEVRRARPRALLGVGLERVLLAGVLCCLRVCLWLLCPPPMSVCLWRLAASCAALGGARRNSRRASGALAASRDVFVSLAKFGGFGAFRSASGLLAALVSVQGALAATRTVASFLGTDPSRQCFGLQHLS